MRFCFLGVACMLVNRLQASSRPSFSPAARLALLVKVMGASSGLTGPAAFFFTPPPACAACSICLARSAGAHTPEDGVRGLEITRWGAAGRSWPGRPAP